MVAYEMRLTILAGIQVLGHPTVVLQQPVMTMSPGDEHSNLLLRRYQYR